MRFLGAMQLITWIPITPYILSLQSGELNSAVFYDLIYACRERPCCDQLTYWHVQGSGNSSNNDGDSESASPSDDDCVQTAGGLEPDGPTPGRGHPRSGRAASANGRHGSGPLNGLATGASVDALSAELFKGSGMGGSIIPAMAGDPSPPLPPLQQNSLMPPLPPLAPQAMTSSYAVSVGGGNRSVAARGQARAAVVSQNRVGNGRGKKPHLKARSFRNERIAEAFPEAFIDSNVAGMVGICCDGRWECVLTRSATWCRVVSRGG